jgi:hypothetical protein
MTNMIKIGLVAAFTAATFGSTAFADLYDPRPVCEAYAKRAVKSVNAANFMNCNITGDLFDPEFGNHYNWCMGLHREPGRQVSEIKAILKGEHKKRAEFIAESCGQN